MSTVLRRLSVAAVAVAIAAIMLRPQLSMTATLRGDEFAALGQTARSSAAYERALVLDPENGVAVDRLLTAAVLHDRELLREEIVRATIYLHAHSDVRVLEDRALAYQVSQRFSEAAADFTAVGRRGHDARALTFAAFDVRRLGDTYRANALLREALRVDPAFRPARRALRRWS